MEKKIMLSLTNLGEQLLTSKILVANIEAKMKYIFILCSKLLFHLNLVSVAKQVID